MNDKHGPDKSLPFVTALVLVLVLWLKYKVELILFYNHFRYVIAFAISSVIFAVLLRLKNKFAKWRAPANLEKRVLGPVEGDDSVFVGNTDGGQPVYIKESYRRMHTEVVGTTNAGKTESVIIPWAIDDMKKGRGFVLIDGKSDRSLLDKLYAYACALGRDKDVKVLSLCDPKISSTFNPLAGGSPLEITERIFKALTFENEYYKNLQYEYLLQTLLIFEAAKIKPTPLKVVELLRSALKIQHFAGVGKERALMEWADGQVALTREEREQRTSGLITQLQVMTVGYTATIFNAESPDIDIDQALAKGHIIYCQLPVLKVPTLGKNVGKLVLQCIQGAASSRHLGVAQNRSFFSVYLDDFTEYLTEGFVSLLNKSRSANLGIVFAHQALGDLATLGDAVKNTILTNANLKIFMRTNEPESAEYFSTTIGTNQTTRVTERQKDGTLGKTKTGEGSIREVEEFKFHPNLFKQSLGIGEGVVILPHSNGCLPFRVKFRKSPDIALRELPEVKKTEPVSLPPLPPKSPAQNPKEPTPAKKINSVVEGAKEVA